MNRAKPVEPTETRIRQLRDRIDRVDQQMLKLLDERGRAAKEIGAIKSGERIAVYAPHRERNVLARIEELNVNGVYTSHAVKSIYREIISATRALEAPSAIAYLGPEATFTHMAAHKFFGEGARYLPQSEKADVFRAVERGFCHHGVVPIENSTHGVVVETLDLFIDSHLQICGETEIAVTHNIMSLSALNEVARIYSHQQALAQCRTWLQTRLPEAELVAVSSTSEGARRAAKEPMTAAIASEIAAEAYGLQILEPRIEDLSGNTTRFLAIGGDSQHSQHAHNINSEPSGDDKTSVFVIIRHEAGSLMRVLEPFAKNGVSLTSIQSRPSRVESWEYGFFIDCHGHLKERKLDEAIRQLRSICLSVKILGSYPRLR